MDAFKKLISLDRFDNYDTYVLEQLKKNQNLTTYPENLLYSHSSEYNSAATLLKLNDTTNKNY
jgi:hypothetical protein